MPLVQISLLSGRTVEQKRKIVDRIANVLVEEAGTKREAVTVVFYDIPKDSFASGAVLVADKK